MSQLQSSMRSLVPCLLSASLAVACEHGNQDSLHGAGASVEPSAKPEVGEPAQPGAFAYDGEATLLPFDVRSIVRTMGKQISIPLARMIQKLKEANIFDRTVIAVFCVDGGREVKSDSYGNMGKNTVLLAGGKIRGGYFGDIRVQSDSGVGHEFSYHAPNLGTGMPGSGFATNEGRIAGKHVWRTIMKAVGVPDSVCEGFPDVAGAAPLSCALAT